MLIQIKSYRIKWLASMENWGIPFFFLLLYLIWPTNNSTIDGWGYAEEIKNGYNLFRAHHLLYNALGYLLIKGFHLFSFYPDVLQVLKMFNALIAFGILLVLGMILKRMNVSVVRRNLWLLFTGSSFGFWRFATENEVYLVPILLSLAGSFYFLLFLQKQKRRLLILAVLMTSLACLFHQLHIFWWLAFFAGLVFMGNWKRSVIIFLLSSFIIPLSYLAVLFFYENESITIKNLLVFVLSDYYSGGAETSIDFRNFLLTPISFFRTFFQLHGNVLLVLKAFPLLYGVVLLAAVFAFAALFELRKIRLVSGCLRQVFFRIHLLAFVLHFLFAFISHGNAEFMVVLIVIIPLLISQSIEFSIRPLWLLSFSMFIWNFSLAIFPNNYFDYNNDKEVVRFIQQHPQAVFILRDRNTIANRYAYETGISAAHRLFKYPYDINDVDLCAHQEMDSVIYSDVLSKKTPMSRASLIEQEMMDDIELVTKGVKTVPSFYGEFTIDRIIIVVCN